MSRPREYVARRCPTYAEVETTGGHMGLLRNRDDHGEQFRMREDLISIGDDYWIENDSGDRVFKVDGKVARLRDTWKLEDRDGKEVAVIREKKLSVRDAITIETMGTQAKVKKALVGIRDRFHVEVDNGEDLKVHGNIVDHEYEVERDGDTVAKVSKKWFRVRDTYGVEIYDPTITPLILAITVAVDALSHDRG
jgi:uncharacterized protein YxjI